MTADHDMEDLTGLDLDRAHESLYFAARRYCLITEQGMVQSASDIDPAAAEFLSIGTAAADLAEAAQRYTAAYSRWAVHQGGEHE